MSASAFEEPKLQRVLEKVAQNEGFKQPKFAISLGSKPGDNFIGRIYRAVISDEDDSKNLSVIIKASPLNHTRQKVLATDLLFAKEAKCYQLVLPTLNNFLKKHGLVESPLFPRTPRFLHVDLGDSSESDGTQVVVVEDKGPEGFRMGDRANGLDADHVRLVLEMQAYLHASSLALHHKEPETAKQLRNELGTDCLWFTDEDHPLLNDLKGGMLKSLKDLKEPYKKGNPVFDRLEKYAENYNAVNLRLQKIPEDLPCVIHGDCSVNNVLFKYNKDGAVEDACLIDFQITRLGSIAHDLLFILLLSTTKETRDAHYDDLLRFYHDKVASILRSLDCDPEKLMPWDLVLDHLRHYGLNVVLLCLVGVPVFMAESSDISVDINSADHEGSVFSSNTTDRKKLEEISKRLTDVISDAARLGYL